MTHPLLDVDRATVGWHGHAVLSDVTFSLRAGEWAGIVGPNGSGKSTLLRAVLGLSKPLAGRVERSSAWRAGHVPQRDALDPLLRFRAEEVVSMAAEIPAWAPRSRLAEKRQAAADALAAVAMTPHARRAYRDLSGGQRQRVLIARALAAAPSVLVLDEPTTGMDVRAEEELLALLRRLRAERGLAILLVTHSLHVVADEATLVGLVGDGYVAFGPPAEIVTEERLAAIWGAPVDVAVVRGHRVVRAKRTAAP